MYGLAALGAFIYNIIFTYFKNPQNPLFNDFINIDGNLIKSHFGTFLLFLGLLIITAYFLIITLSKKPFMNIGIALIALLFSSNFYFWQSRPLRETLRAQIYARWHQGDTNSLQWIEAAEWLNHNTKNPNVALTGFTYSYPLYGRNYEHNVEYININDCIDCRTSDYRKNGLESRSEQSFQSWLENINKKNIEYLVIDKKTFPNMHEYIWVQNKKEIFEEVYKNNLVSIFHLTQH